MGETAAIVMGAQAKVTPKLSRIVLRDMPAEAWLDFAKGMLDRALTCYEKGEIDCPTAVHWVAVSSDGCPEHDRRQLRGSDLADPRTRPQQQCLLVLACLRDSSPWRSEASPTGLRPSSALG